MTSTPEAPARDAVKTLWASPFCFITAAFVAFNVFDHKGAGWSLMAASLLGPLAALALGAVRRERPDSFVIVPLGGMALFTVLFGINEGFPWA
ncbi:hypothetical protein [Streptomyces lanatus]|uniref:Integral membrane protein n=1 Tax=Streptomyces lanatus TaxID=66900 RepID=A0ABV1XRT8_9ACTN|nr:hypothetical protein [Streptomyces lanatus]GHH04912.1 hypothetical protein GCM10018780_35850 [Streptomyces lanatus]